MFRTCLGNVTFLSFLQYKSDPVTVICMHMYTANRKCLQLIRQSLNWVFFFFFQLLQSLSRATKETLSWLSISIEGGGDICHSHCRTGDAAASTAPGLSEPPPAWRWGSAPSLHAWPHDPCASHADAHAAPWQEEERGEKACEEMVEAEGKMHAQF